MRTVAKAQRMILNWIWNFTARTSSGKSL